MGNLSCVKKEEEMKRNERGHKNVRREKSPFVSNPWNELVLAWVLLAAQELVRPESRLR